MAEIIVRNILWDDDGDMEVSETLPQEMSVPDGMTDIDEISDWITDQTGFCHKGFEICDV